MTRQPTTTLLLLLVSAAIVTAQQGQQPSAMPSSAPSVAPSVVAQSNLACSVYNHCFDCVNAGCAYGIGTCFSSCTDLPELPCYTVDWFSTNLNTAEAVCDLQQKETTDAAFCGVQTSCEACTSTPLSAVRQETNLTGTPTCHWYEDRQTCSNVECDSLGCSSPYCPGTPQGDCYFGADNCLDCLTAIDSQSCSWTGGSCELNCLADTTCYSPQLFPDLTETAICEAAATFDADSSLCLGQVDCTSCIQAIQSTGTACGWYYDSATSTGWCGMGGCDANGHCAVETCDGVPGSNTGPTCAAVAQLPPEQVTCQSCLDASCAWTGAGAQCLENCDLLADAPCYTVPEGSVETTESVCARVETDSIDAGLCDVATGLGCASCTATLKSDGVSTCSWYQDSFSGSGYCGAGTGCDQNGNCGSSTCDGPATTGSGICNTAFTCSTCLGTAPCVWDGNACLESCADVGFGAICYSGTEPNFALQSNYAICQQAATASANNGGNLDIGTGTEEPRSSAIRGSNLLVASLVAVVATIM